MKTHLLRLFDPAVLYTMYNKFQLEAVKTTFYRNSNKIPTQDNVYSRIQHRAFVPEL